MMILTWFLGILTLNTETINMPLKSDIIELPAELQEYNLLAWMTANGSVVLAGYMTDIPVALSWEQLKLVAPQLANGLKNAGIGTERMPQDWKNNPNLLDARGASVYTQNIPDAIARLGPDAIAQFKEGKHWSHQISYKQGIEQGISPEDLADPKNGIFENAQDNIRRGAKKMPDGWGDSTNPGRLKIQEVRHRIISLKNLMFITQFKQEHENYTNWQEVHQQDQKIITRINYKLTLFNQLLNQVY